MIYRIIIILGILCGLILLKKSESNFIKIIFFGLTVTFGISFLEGSLWKNIAFYGFYSTNLIFTVYCFINRKWYPFIIAFFGFLLFIWAGFNWIYAWEIKLLMIIPLICFTLILQNWKKYKNELSVLIVLASDELTELMRLIASWIN